MKKAFNENYIFIPIFLIAATILSLKGSTSYDEQLSVAGIILFTVFYGYIVFLSRKSKTKMLLALATYLFFIGIYLFGLN